jgi:ABC-type glycerol-3-phosphate transport system substrate-binding protein
MDMMQSSFRKALRAASALTLAAGMAVAASAVSAQDKKVVPFLTAENSPEAVAQMQGLIDRFEKENPEIDVELQLMSNDDRMGRAINAVAVGDELGIFEIERRLVPDFTRAGYLLQLDSVVDEIGADKFIPGSLLYWPWDGHLYQFTADLSGGTMYWRKDLFEKAGLAEPDSYERLLEASEKLNGQDGVAGNAFESSNDGGVQRFVTFLWQNCGDFYTREGNLAFDRPGSKQATEDYAALNQYAPSGNHSWGSRDPVNAYVAGRAAMALYPGRLGFEVFSKAPDIAKVTGNREARVAREGKGPRVVYGAVTSYAIGSTVKHPDEAKKFLKFLFTGEPLMEYALGVPGHVAPALKEEQSHLLEQDHPYLKEHRDWVELILEATTYANHEAQNMGSIKDNCEFEKSTVPMPWSSRVMGQAPVVTTMFQKIDLQDMPVEAAYKEAVDAFRNEMEKWKAENTWFTPPPAEAPKK